MKLCEIRNRIELACKRMDEIKPAIKCYMVVMINYIQLMPLNLIPDNDRRLDLWKHSGFFATDLDFKPIINLMDLWKYSDAFLTGQSLKPLIENGEEIRDLKKRIENLMKNGGKTKENELREFEIKMKALVQKYYEAIEGMEFYESSIELRFFNLDMEKIQEIKKCPVVQEVGKTEMSGVGIRVVIG